MDLVSRLHLRRVKCLQPVRENSTCTLICLRPLLEIIKSDLPLNPETATDAQLSYGQTASTVVPGTGTVTITVCYRVSDFVGGHLTCIMIAHQGRKEQEGFLPATDHHIQPFLSSIWAPVSVFILFLRQKSILSYFSRLRMFHFCFENKKDFFRPLSQQLQSLFLSCCAEVLLPAPSLANGIAHTVIYFPKTQKSRSPAFSQAIGNKHLSFSTFRYPIDPIFLHSGIHWPYRRPHSTVP